VEVRNQMGIIRRLLRKGGKAPSSVVEQSEDASEAEERLSVDPLAPASSEPRSSVLARDTDLSAPKGPAREERRAPAISQDTASPASTMIPTGSIRPPREKIAPATMDTKSRPGGARGRLREAEETVASAEAKLAEIEKESPAAPGVFAGIRIKLLEVKIRLAETEIKLAEVEDGAPRSDECLLELNAIFTDAEKKLADCESRVGEIASQQSRIKLVELKIKLSEAKIKLFEVKILLHGGEGAKSQYADLPSPAPARRPDHPSPVPPTEMRPEDAGKGKSAAGMRGPDEEPGVVLKQTPREITGVPMGIEEREPDAGKSAVAPKSVSIGIPDTDADGIELGVSLDRIKFRADTSEPPRNDPAAHLSRVEIPERAEERRPNEPSPVPDRLKITADSLGIARERAETTASEQESEAPKMEIRRGEADIHLIVEDLNKRGVELRKQGKYDEAIACFDRIMEITPDNEAAWNNKGVALRKMERYEEALPWFDKVIERDASSASAWFNRSFTLFKLCRYEEALQSFDEVLAIDPNQAIAWNSKGKTLEKLDRKEEARACFIRANELGFSG
jgi:tetratricopeptide (TPR) repeat protein